MAMKRYVNIGMFPIRFTDRASDGWPLAEKIVQEAECNEEFDRDFAASNNPSQETYLLSCNIIREVKPVPSPRDIRQALIQKEEDDAVSGSY